ncbi:hypothetical protein ACHQM5_007844 [Ranunculus cassubicifolius]
MAAGIAVVEEAPKPYSETTLSSYLGLSFAIFLAYLPQSSISLVSSLQSRNNSLSTKLNQAEEQLKQMRSRRKEDSKANARVVEIFASHRNGWQQEEKRLLHQIDASAEEIAHLRKSDAELRMMVDKLQREVDDREEMINFMSRRNNDDDDYSVEKLEVKNESDVEAGYYASQIRASSYESYRSRCIDDDEENNNGDFHTSTNFMNFSRFDEMRVSEGLDPVPEEFLMDGDGNQGDTGGFLFGRDLLPSASKVWAERSSDWQDLQCDSLEPSYQTKHFVARRDSPRKLDGESAGVTSKLKLLEEELINLEHIDKGELSKVPSLFRKQAKRYQALAGKINDLCRKMRANNLSEPTLSLEFRTRHQTEFLIEAYRLQQRATETAQKLTILQTETVKSNLRKEVENHARLATRRSLDCIRNNLREIQRNLEVWLARILGDLEGNLASDGASRVREYYMARYPFVQ